MRKVLLFSMAILTAFTLAACQSFGKVSPTAEPTQAEATQGPGGEAQDVLTPEEAYAMMTGEAPVVVVDVRTAEEYTQWHIPGAVLVPNEEIVDKEPELLPLKNAKILIYCRSGNRSAQAVQKLKAMGYTQVWDFGGIMDWPYETETGAWEDPFDKQGTLSSFTTFDLYGRLVDESVFADKKLTMINIWATFCSPCLDELPELGAISREYEDKGFQIIGIAIDTTNTNGTYSLNQVDTAKGIAASTKADFLHILPSPDLNAAKLNAVMSVPETIFVDSQGNLVGKSYIGSRSGDAWKQIIDELLADMEG